MSDRAMLEDMKLQAEIVKLLNETGKIQAETIKVQQETIKLNRETVKLNSETKWYPVVVAATAMGAATAVTALILKFM